MRSWLARCSATSHKRWSHHNFSGVSTNAAHAPPHHSQPATAECEGLSARAPCPSWPERPGSCVERRVARLVVASGRWLQAISQSRESCEFKDAAQGRHPSSCMVKECSGQILLHQGGTPSFCRVPSAAHQGFNALSSSSMVKECSGSGGRPKAFVPSRAAPVLVCAAGLARCATTRPVQKISARRI